MLIPFGLRKSDGKFCDVADAPRGKKCGCICPSCKTPLIARQGKVNHWHFAHASRQVFSETQNNCVFSFFVAVRMMARQVIGEQIEITLPACKGKVSEYVAGYGRYFSEQFTVAERQKITITNTEVEQSFLGIPVDVYGLVGDFHFIIYFTHPGRLVPQVFHNPPDTKCGIIGVSLDRLHSLFFVNGEKSIKSYLTILNDFLVNDVLSKKWIFHPRYKRLKKSAKSKLAEKTGDLKKRLKLTEKTGDLKQRSDLTETKIGDFKQRSNFCEKESIPSVPKFESAWRPFVNNVPEEKPKRLENFECVMCAVQWKDSYPSGSVCPACKSHLYSRSTGYADPEN